MSVRSRVPRPRRLLGAVLVATLGLAGAVGTAAAPAAARTASTPGALAAAFDGAAARYDVPRDLLVALGQAETRLDGHAGEASASGGYGVMHLVSNPRVHTLEEAARLTGLDLPALRTDPAANVTGAAAVLRSYADQAGLGRAERADVDRWYEPIARYGGASDPAVARLYADAVYDLLRTGFTAGAEAAVTVAGRPVAPHRGALGQVSPTGGIGTLSTDYGPAAWAPASTSNYTVASRPTSHPVRYVVIHVTQGSYAGSISWFQNPAAKVSAHYTFRSSDGAVTQSVREKDIAWHAGNWTYNTQSIGIEHEGYVDNPSWFTDAMYRASAALTRNLTSRYGIPRDRTHIIGHREVPGATHTDPGPNWNWTYYLQLVNGITGIGSGTVGTSGSSLNVRSGPGTGYAVVGSVADGAGVSIYCQATGTTVTGTYGTSNVWNRIGTNRYISDAYVLTGHDGFIPGVPRC
ncbi:Transglycosylase SLT domain-containing protein [Micromonospora echinaurantiaca]|uniref:N-acetylmuramoyl-L-alanine amidase n=1 Tax=Micromonospora echinaurantiaca TaxID=47857 RepID=A0A1C5K369_9ACTN|nr:N-acetylmuramoyl-L-alanine amidase [Micromonospora echinaurantiaca]SCG77260.1 Transglycosylase SLT domain-containing protein [Micromonospora echinaurantiaca]